MMEGSGAGFLWLKDSDADPGDPKHTDSTDPNPDPKHLNLEYLLNNVQSFIEET